MFKLILEKLLNAFGYESSRQKKAREVEAYAQREIEQREAREIEIQQKEQRVKLAQGLIEHLMPQVALNYCMDARPIDQLLSESSRELKGEVLQRFQAEVLELCKKTLDSRIQSDKKNDGFGLFDSFRAYLLQCLEDHPIISLLTPGKDIKDALDEEEKGKIVKYLEKQCKQVKHWELKRSMPQCSVRKDLANIELLDRLGLGRIANNAYYKSAGDELLKKYLETQVYNVILGHYDGRAANTLVTDHNRDIIPSLYYYLQSWGSRTNVFNEYSQESYTHRAITSIKSALGHEEFKKCVAEIMQDFESKRRGFNAKMQELCTELQITDSVALKKLIDGNIKSVKKIAGIAEQGQWANFAQQNNSQISTRSNIIGG